MQLGIPALIASSSSGSAAQNYSGYIDLNYKVYNTRLIQFSVPNAFTADNSNLSQTEFGIAEMPSRYSQNNAWNSAFALALAVGNGALNLHSITRSFISDIKDVKFAKIRFGIFSQTVVGKSIGLDFSTGKINSITESLNTTPIATGIGKEKGFIANNGANYFLVIATESANIKTIPCDVNGNIIAGTINTLGVSNFSSVVAVKGQYVWVVYGQMSGTRGFFGQLYSISATGVLTGVGAALQLTMTASGSWTSYGGNTFSIDSYTVANTCYMYVCSRNIGNSRYAETSYSINLSTVTAFTGTGFNTAPNIAPNFGNYGGKVEVGFDGTRILVHMSTKLFALTASTVTELATLTRQPGFCRYRNSADKIALNVNNFSTNNDNSGFVFNGVDMLTTDSSLLGKFVAIFKLDGTVEEDDAGAFQKIISTDAFSNTIDGLTFKVNTVTKGYDLIGNLGALTIPSSYVLSEGTKYIDFHLGITNTLARQIKMGFQVTGGNYTSPTGANNTTGNATAGRTANANSSYIDLTVS